MVAGSTAAAAVADYLADVVDGGFWFLFFARCCCPVATGVVVVASLILILDFVLDRARLWE